MAAVERETIPFSAAAFFRYTPRWNLKQIKKRPHQPPAIVKTTEKILIFRGFSA